MSEKSLKSKTLSIIAYIMTLGALVFLLSYHLDELIDGVNALGHGKNNSLMGIGKVIESFIFIVLIFTSFGMISYGFYKERINDPSKYSLLVPCIFLGYFMINCASSVINAFTTLEQEGFTLFWSMILFALSVCGFAGVIILFMKSDYLDIKLYLEDNGVEFEETEEDDDDDEEKEFYDPEYDPEVNPNVYNLFPDVVLEDEEGNSSNQEETESKEEVNKNEEE